MSAQSGSNAVVGVHGGVKPETAVLDDCLRRLNTEERIPVMQQIAGSREEVDGQGKGAEQRREQVRRVPQPLHQTARATTCSQFRGSSVIPISSYACATERFRTGMATSTGTPGSAPLAN